MSIIINKIIYEILGITIKFVPANKHVPLLFVLN